MWVWHTLQSRWCVSLTWPGSLSAPPVIHRTRRPKAVGIPDDILKQALAEFEATHDLQGSGVGGDRVAVLFYDTLKRVVHPPKEADLAPRTDDTMCGLAAKMEAFVKDKVGGWQAQAHDLAAHVQSATGTAVQATYTHAGAAVERAEKAATHLVAQAAHGVEVRCFHQKTAGERLPVPPCLTACCGRDQARCPACGGRDGTQGVCSQADGCAWGAGGGDGCAASRPKRAAWCAEGWLVAGGRGTRGCTCGCCGSVWRNSCSRASCRPGAVVRCCAC